MIVRVYVCVYVFLPHNRLLLLLFNFSSLASSFNCIHSIWIDRKFRSLCENQTQEEQQLSLNMDKFRFIYKYVYAHSPLHLCIHMSGFLLLKLNNNGKRFAIDNTKQKRIKQNKTKKQFSQRKDEYVCIKCKWKSITDLWELSFVYSKLRTTTVTYHLIIKMNDLFSIPCFLNFKKKMLSLDNQDI